MHKNLRPRQEYIDRYDRTTVETCRHLGKLVDASAVEHQPKESHHTPEQYARIFNELAIWFEAGERQLRKEKTIDDWMANDAKLDNLLTSAKAPEDIQCFSCGRVMKESVRQLESNKRVLFMLECPAGHIPRRAFYEDGEEWFRKKPRCKKCGGDVNEEDKDTEVAFRTIMTCRSCGNIETINIERHQGKTVADPDYVKDRERFCYSGRVAEYVRFKETSKDLLDLVEKKKVDEKAQIIKEKLGNIKRLRITEAEDLIIKALEGTGYVKFSFKEPEMGKIVTVPFVVYDPKVDRGEEESYDMLKNILSNALESTNWRLTKEGVGYRLGMLSGGLRVYEKDTELLSLINII